MSETQNQPQGLRPGEWNALVAPLVARCEVAAAFGQEAVWEPRGADALGKVLKHMADTLDSLSVAGTEDRLPPASDRQAEGDAVRGG